MFSRKGLRNSMACLCVAIFICGCRPRPDSQGTQVPSFPTRIETETFDTPTPIPSESAQTLPTLSQDDYRQVRERMVQDGIIGWGIEDVAVIEVMRKVHRHEFVPVQYLGYAYENHPLPIGYGQTISQPYIVALMTQELDVSEGDRVLEIGTGSGYQAAVLAELGVEVYTIEIIGPLAELAAERFTSLGYHQIATKHADGYYGWEEFGPFDGIIVTAAPDHVPQPLLTQLIVGGNLVIPVGPIGGIQELWRIERISETEYQSISLGGVQFVPLTRIEESP